ncbi:MAG: UDP-2,4-diacetamido-2,4,6-trideoxy-beta-L-altropyranose hydrolase [Caulobacteraceae bacterium]
MLLAPAAGDGVGGGHVMRCLALAQALASRGARCAFAVNDAGRSILERFSDTAWPIEPAGAVADVLVIDNYAVAADEERALKPHAAMLAVIDDLADRPHLADLLVDPGDGRVAPDYAGLVPDGAVLLMGPAYALLRASFAERRAERRSTQNGEISRVFVSFGLSDVDGVTGRAVAALRPLAPAAVFDIALPSSAASLPALGAMAAADPGLHLHIDATDVDRLLIEADAAIGAGGASTWERCCLGVPSIAVSVADNQRPLIERLSASGVVLGLSHSGDLEFKEALAAAFLRLRDPTIRADLAVKSLAVCDGQGAARVADAILAQLSRITSDAGS